VLESYYLLFLHSVARNQNQHDYEYLSSRALNTYLLGEHVAPRWSLGRILRWTPTVSQDVLLAHKNIKKSSAKAKQFADAELENALTGNPGIVRSVGLYKVMGDAVQSVMGGVYHQFVCPITLYQITNLKCCDHRSRIHFVGWFSGSSLVSHPYSSPYPVAGQGRGCPRRIPSSGTDNL
jgi:hypothetical protein